MILDGRITDGSGFHVDNTPKRWRYSVSDLADAVATSDSYRQILAKLGLSKQGGGSYETIKRRIALLDLDTSHLTG